MFQCSVLNRDWMQSFLPCSHVKTSQKQFPQASWNKLNCSTKKTLVTSILFEVTSTLLSPSDFERSGVEANIHGEARINLGGAGCLLVQSSRREGFQILSKTSKLPRLICSWQRGFCGDMQTDDESQRRCDVAYEICYATPPSLLRHRFLGSLELSSGIS
jgi:hypothetical protein